MAFNPKRTPPAELARIVEAEAGRALPTTTPPVGPAGQPARPRAESTVQINFRATVPMAKLIATLAEREGGSCQYRMNSPQKCRLKTPHFVAHQSRPYPRGGSMVARSSRSRSTMACRASAVAVSRSPSGKLSAQAA